MLKMWLVITKQGMPPGLNERRPFMSVAEKVSKKHAFPFTNHLEKKKKDLISRKLSLPKSVALCMFTSAQMC